MRQADSQQKGKVEDLLIWGYSTGWLIQEFFFTLHVLNLNYTKSFTTLYSHNSFFITTSKFSIKVTRWKKWRIEAPINFGAPCRLPSNSRSSTFPFGWQSACLICKPIYECFLPKSNLRPILGSHRSLWGPQKCKNKLIAALFLMHNQMNHPVQQVWVEKKQYRGCLSRAYFYWDRTHVCCFCIEIWLCLILILQLVLNTTFGLH